MLYQRVTGDFYTINSEGKFTLPQQGSPLRRQGKHDIFIREARRRRRKVPAGK